MPATQLNAVQSIAVDDSGNIYVLDAGDRRVLKLPAGATTPTNLPFAGLAESPWSVAVDKGGNVYVSDQEHQRIMKLAEGASSATEVHFPGLVDPLGITIDGDGNLYVVNCAGSDDCATGKVLELGAPQ
jgi:serine/threonine protein kinase, bacterial